MIQQLSHFPSVLHNLLLLIDQNNSPTQQVASQTGMPGVEEGAVQGTACTARLQLASIGPLAP